MADTKTTKRLTKAAYSNLTKEEKAARRKAFNDEVTAAYETALANLTDSGQFRDYLAATAVCHSYSLRNTIWVMFQRGGDFVPPIASHDTWKKTLGYQVKKGERAARVWVPVLVKTNDLDDNGEQKKILRFKTGPVFTRDQVNPIEGKALAIDPPTPAPVTGDSHKMLIPKLLALAEKNGYTIKELAADEAPEAEGFHDRSSKVIAYRPERPANSIVRVLTHEIIHSFGIGYREFGRARAEVITDSATFMCCRMFGLDVEKASIPYVLGWSGKDTDTIAADLTLMQNLANQIIDQAGLESHLALSEAEAAMRQKKKERSQ